MKNLILASTSTVHGSGYLEYLLPELKDLYKSVPEVLFIPYARPGGLSYDEYTDLAAKEFEKIGIRLKSIHTFDDPGLAIELADGIFCGGGNTFVLLRELAQSNLLELLKEKLETGIPYLGTSAGSNICGINIQNTNDMPIVPVLSYKGLGLISFNLNVHYLDPDPKSTHKGESRETRIKEFHIYNDIPVVGLREGSWLKVNNEHVLLGGELNARLFSAKAEPSEIAKGSKIEI